MHPRVITANDARRRASNTGTGSHLLATGRSSVRLFTNSSRLPRRRRYARATHLLPPSPHRARGAGGGRAFEQFIESKLTDYRTLLDDLSDPTTFASEIRSRRTAIDDLCGNLQQVIQSAFSGQPSEANSRFESAVQPIISWLKHLEAANLTADELGNIYRVRRHLGAPLTREDLFHIPFEARHKVATQRYSVPGLPCLYLSGSLYTCWAEMGRPGFYEIFASAFWLAHNQKVSVVNLSQKPGRLLKRLAPDGSLQNPLDQDSLLAHVSVWPLIALCSIVVKHRDSPFKPEYILPQIVLQWITRESAFDGICYFSTHVPALAPNNKPNVVCNFVFPAKEIKPAGRCRKLRRLFKLTEPQSWQLLSAIGAPATRFQVQAPFFEFEFINGIKQQYAETEFGQVQNRLDYLVAETKHLNGAGSPELGDTIE